MTKIGFIGLGPIGLPMAKNLLKAGFEIKGFDFSGKAIPKAEKVEKTDKDEKTDKAEKENIKFVESIAEAAKGVDVVISMVPEGKDSKAVFLNDDGILKNADKETLLIDCSATFIATNLAIQNAAAKAGFQMLDAPVSGGVSEAEAGTLAFMVCGDDKAFYEGEPILKKIAGKIFHMGTGRASKKRTGDEGSRVIYKKRLPWRGVAVVMIFLFLGGNAILFSMIEENIKIVQGRLTVTYSLSETEHKIFCGGSRILGLDIDGC